MDQDKDRFVFIIVELPLPPSKNVAKGSKTFYHRGMGRVMSLKVNSEAVIRYRIYVQRRVKQVLEDAGVQFKTKADIVVGCRWRKPSNRYDCHNWHQELADALQLGTGVNDRYYLIRDLSYTVNPKDPGVTVELMQSIQ